ncbi:hypothetical protein ERO13_A06G107300v2 [Gossypium hirsutum]|uniref:Basic leucine zipper 9 n=1 Tax=Gossypium hirsutum TaxID=3635 RepID=A0A1U8PVH6_GOSHI|nr:basic leucine zipper 9 [Gossypium hirsutum]KAG4195361.1 hypothetical protein ERO13_A06G107300v2 [Gossypium hirsutum]
MKRSASELALEEFSRNTLSTTTIAAPSAFPDFALHPPIAHLSNSFHFTEFPRDAAEFSPQTHVLLSQTLTSHLDSQSSFCGNESWGSTVCEGNNSNYRSRENEVRGATTPSSDHDQSDDDDDDVEEEDDDDDDEDEEGGEGEGEVEEADAGQSEQSLDPSHLKRLRRKLSNRESARRSRKRKQEQLAELEFQAEQLRGENDSLCKQLTNAHQLIRDVGTNNRVLTSNVQALRHKVKLAEDMLAGGSFTCGLNQLVQSHLTSQQPIATNNHNLGRVVNVSPTITVQGDSSSYAGFTDMGNSPNLGLPTLDFTNSNQNNIGIGGDAMSWP